MSSLRNVVAAVSRWIDCVAATIVAAVGRLTFPRTVRIEEEEGGRFAVRSGGQGDAAGSPSLRVQIADGRVVAANPQQLATMLRGSRAELVTARLPIPVPPARTAGPRVGVPRRDRACPNRPADAMESRPTPSSAGASQPRRAPNASS